MEGASIPFMISLSKTNPFIFLESTSLAHTTNTLAIGELVIQFLAPFSNQLPSFCYLHVVDILPGSDPTLGSVKPKHPMTSPFIRSSKYLSLTFLVPNLCIGCMTKELYTLNADL